MFLLPTAPQPFLSASVLLSGPLVSLQSFVTLASDARHYFNCSTTSRTACRHRPATSVSLPLSPLTCSVPVTAQSLHPALPSPLTQPTSLTSGREKAVTSFGLPLGQLDHHKFVLQMLPRLLVYLAIIVWTSSMKVVLKACSNTSTCYYS